VQVRGGGNVARDRSAAEEQVGEQVRERVRHAAGGSPAGLGECRTSGGAVPCSGGGTVRTGAAQGVYAPPKVRFSVKKGRSVQPFRSVHYS